MVVSEDKRITGKPDDPWIERRLERRLGRYATDGSVYLGSRQRTVIPELQSVTTRV